MRKKAKHRPRAKGQNTDKIVLQGEVSNGDTLHREGEKPHTKQRKSYFGGPLRDVAF